MIEKLIEHELAEFVNGFADIVIDAVRLRLSQPTLESLDMALGLTLVPRLGTICYWLVGPPPSGHQFRSTSLGHLQKHSGFILQSDLVSKAIRDRAEAVWGALGRPPMEMPLGWKLGMWYELPADWESNRDHISSRYGTFLGRYEKRIADANQARRDAEQAEQRAAAAARAEVVQNRPAPAPSPLPYGVSHRGAETLAADWMRHIGILDAGVTPAQADGGIDVSSDTHVVQVKHYKGQRRSRRTA